MAVELVEADPYRTWLGIQETRRPLNPYQLLALVPLEADQARIRAGYERQLAALSRYADRAGPERWRMLHGEIEDAYMQLADPEQKAVVDAAIRRRGGGSTGGQSAGTCGNPAGALVTCKRCQRANPANRRFCGGCGLSLWEKCPKCGTEASADERFCGSCGADIAGGLDDQNQQYENQFNEALERAADYHFDKAQSALRGLAAISDPRFERWAQDALEALARIEARKRTALAAAESALAKARQLMDSQSFEGVQAAIEEVPTQLRTAQHDLLLERARSCRQELLKLSGEIRHAVEQKRHSELLPKLERLLALKPNHAQARALADQLRDKLVKTAQARLGQHKYREALDALEQLPPFARSEEVETLTETASELESLLVELRTAALANQQLVGLADRLCKLATDNTEATELRSQINDRVRALPAEPRLGAPDWAPPPQRTLVGVPVDWLAHLVRPEAGSDNVRGLLADHPGQFFTAFGLALQGVGLARVEADLMPQDKAGMLGLLPTLSFSRKQENVAWGLDLSDYALKAIKLSRPVKSDEVKIEACEYILHDMPLSSPDLDKHGSEMVDKTLRDFVDRAGDLKNASIIAGMPGHRVLGRFFELPPMPRKKVSDSIQYEVRHQLPIALEDVCWSQQLLGEVESKAADEQPRRVLVQAAREAQVRDRLSQFKAAGLGVDKIQSDTVALHNALCYEMFAADHAGEEAIALLDLGTTTSNIVISSPRCLWFRTFSTGGETFTRELIREFKLTYEQAEQWKREPARARRFHPLQDAMRPLLVQLTSEVERSLAMYARSYADHPVQRLYGLGGGFQAHGVLRHLRSGK